ncbi:MAG: SpoIIE family protein phosphatase [Desulfobacteraceae bacterium]|nr:SpoIIE family protein phosphatase [Desulfobacteraceae bacterium]
METIPAHNLIAQKPSDLTSCISKVERLANCIEISNLINSELSIGKLLNHIMEATKKAFIADSVSLLLVDQKTDDLIFHIALGDVGNEIKEIFRIKKGSGIAGHVAQTDATLNLIDAYDHPKFLKDYDEKTNYRTKSMLCVPLKTRGQTIGVIQVINKLIDPFYFTNEELEMLVTIASSAAVAVHTAQMHQALLQRQALERDLLLAKEVQESFLPHDFPDIKGFSFAAMNQPALEVGGDFYNFFKLPDDKLGIALGDVSGKGISASLFMARLTSDLQYYALLCETPSQLMIQLNSVLCERAKRGMFVTLIYMVLDITKRQICFSNAGHLPPVHCDKTGAILLDDDTKKGPPLGVLTDVKFDQQTFDLNSTSVVTIYTDGIIEAKNSSGKLFGIKRLLKEIEKQTVDPTERIQQIANRVDRFAQGVGRSDDLTLLCFGLDPGE